MSAAAFGASPAAAEEPSSFQKVRERLTDIWQTGSSDFYVPLRTHHLRSAYSREQIDRYQEAPLGIGYGRSKFDRDGDLQRVFGMVFQDSHFKPNYTVGYAFEKSWRPAADWRLGGGFTAFVMTRPDIGHYTPFPGVLPFGSVSYKNVSVEATYVPGAGGAGNVVFFWGRFRLD